MSDVQPNPSWWQASDDKWYPPELHPSATPPEPPPSEEPPPSATPPEAQPPAAEPPAEEPPGPAVIGTPGTGAAEVAERERKGIEGEQATHDALTTLPSSYRVAHGLKIGTTKGDIDHVVIGPSGVWVIDSKNWSGSLSAGKGTLWRGRTPIRREVTSVEDQAAYAKRALGLDTSPMLCFIGTRLPRPAQMVGRCRVVSLDALVPYLEANPSVLTPEQVDAAFRRVEAWAVKPPADPRRSKPGKTIPARALSRTRPARVAKPRMAPKPSRRSRPTATKPRHRSSSTKWGALIFGGLTLVAMMAFLTSPGLIDDASERILDVFTPTTEPPTSVAGTSTTAPDRDDFTATVSCPAPGGGYTIDGRAAIVLDGRIRLSALIAGEALYLGELQSYQPAEPITGLAPNESVMFEIQSVDRSGQAGESYHIEVVTPEAPC